MSYTTVISKKIKLRREALGLSDVEAAQRVGFNIYEYGDIEDRDDEVLTVADLQHVKIICEVLNLDFLELFDMKCAFCEGGKPYIEDYKLPRNELIRKRRRELNISEAALAELTNVKEWAIDNLEKNPDELEIWGLDQIDFEGYVYKVDEHGNPVKYDLEGCKPLSNVLDIPFQILAGVKCSKCGR